MSKLQHFLLLVVAITLISCNEDGICLKGEGVDETRVLELDDFEGVAATGSIQVYIKRGPDQHVEVKGQPNILDVLETDVSGNVWEIQFSRCVKDLEPVEVFITLPQLNQATVSGSGFIQVEDKFRSKEFSVSVSGSGDVKGKIETDRLESRISGSGTVNMSGSAIEQDISISGSGNHHAFDLNTEDSEVRISGSGRAQVIASKKLDVSISGSGRVFYKGNPETNVNVSGSGRLIKE